MFVQVGSIQIKLSVLPLEFVCLGAPLVYEAFHECVFSVFADFIPPLGTADVFVEEG